jgi:hypothetical protein
VTPIGIVGAAGGIAGYGLTLSKSLVHRDSDDASGYPDVEVFSIADRGKFIMD